MSARGKTWIEEFGSRGREAPVPDDTGSRDPDNVDELASSGQPLDLPDADVTFHPHLFGAEESDRFLSELSESIAWRQEMIATDKGAVPIPRLTAWYGDPGRSYSFSGIKMEATPWTDPLIAIRARIEQVSDTSFNSVLINMYRDGRDGVGWHSDDEPELGERPVIGSVSFGGIRTFVLRHKKRNHEGHRLRMELKLTPGSYLLMRGETQRFWMHQVPKTDDPVEPRINLTFRLIGERDGPRYLRR
jgi:alkylated DNA repair dioxygenase AlkB